MSAPLSPAADDAARAVELGAFIDASPTPYHAVANVAASLEAAGFSRLDEAERWDDTIGDRYLVRGGTLVAWRGSANHLDAGLRIIGAHTDSPNLRLKPNPDTGRAGYAQLGVEVYGGALWNSWLGRDLGLAGRLALRSGDEGRSEAIDEVLVTIDEPLLQIPQLAIHLDRGVNESGLVLNPQQHLQPVWGLGPPRPGALVELVAATAGVDPARVAGFDLMCHDLAPSQVIGRDGALLSAPRLDNLLSCWAGLEAFLATPVDAPGIGVLALFDHEEVGSASASGAAGSVLPSTLERLVLGLGGDRAELAAVIARSWCVSADGAHAVHPNYADRHDPAHQVLPNAGPVIKHNANERYATDAVSAAHFQSCCDQAGVPVQQFAMRSDLACGSTIGPLTAAGLGVRTVDVGVAQLAMHSARELCGSADPALFVRALAAFLQS